MANYQGALVGLKAANRVAFGLLTAMLFGAGLLLFAEDSPTRESTEVTTVETTQSKVSEAGKTSSTTTTQKTTSPVAEPSVIERLASPAAALLTKSILLLASAFLAAALIQRALLGFYAIKVGSVELAAIPDEIADDIGLALRNLAEQPARAIASSGQPAAADEELPLRTENRELEEDVTVLTTSAVTGLVQLRLELERVIRSLATPPPQDPGTAISIVEVLIKRGVVPADVRKPLDAVLQAGDRAALGYRIPNRVSRAAEQAGQPILHDLAHRRRFVAVRFEDHVLSLLASVAPDRASVKENDDRGSVNVDATIRLDANEIAVEVRARLTPESPTELERVTRLVAGLPPALPVVLVVAGIGLTDRQLGDLQVGRQGKVYRCRWDEEHETFGDLLTKALASQP